MAPKGIGYGKKLKRATANKQAYLKQYKARIAKRDPSTPTYAQWAAASKTTKQLMAAGVGQKRLRRMGAK